MAEPKTTIPQGSWILVTGQTGFVASHIAKIFLERGYKVRGTVRDLKKASWLVNDVFKSYTDHGDFELVEVPDLGADHAFDDAIKGMSAVAHVATVANFDPDPNNVVTSTVAGTVSILEAALKEPLVKQFVYTSSIVAAVLPLPGLNTHVERDTWNEDAVKLAWAPPPYDSNRGMFVYMASKVAAEKAVWKFVEERKPHFTVNTVNPASILGEPLNIKHVETDYAWVKVVYDGKTAPLEGLPSTIPVDVADVALLHVAAILDPEVKNARLQAWAKPCGWNDILAIMRKLYPQRKFIPDLPDAPLLAFSTDVSQPIYLLRKWGHQDGFKSLEQMVEENLKPIVAWDTQN
ncbi:putative NAD dependent epimerase/dehydratase [Stipitochalara longipes BDJ]|nr:putative NAD dependent epimerase/dehydratase [Stipitochalara longipes BDJ]